MSKLPQSQLAECYLCGAFGPFHRHHIDCNHKNNNPSNIVLLCEHCHVELHRAGKINRESLDFIRQQVIEKHPDEFVQ